MGSIAELANEVEKRDLQIRSLEAKLKLREAEIMELKSQLDKFQSVFPYAAAPSSSRARKRQGISAEPQSVKELASLCQTTFPVVPKSLRYVYNN